MKIGVTLTLLVFSLALASAGCSGGTQAQDVFSKSQSIHRTCAWHVQNHLLDGSEVILANAAVATAAAPLDDGAQLTYTDLRMYVHRRLGRIALVRNEVADWYYEQSH
jgi:hypothetical protein